MQDIFRFVSVTESVIRKLTQTINTIPVWWYIIDIPTSSGLYVNVRRLDNWSFAHEKIAIEYSITKTGVVRLNV